MNKIVKQVYLKSLLRIRMPAVFGWYQADLYDAEKLVECLIDRAKAIPSMVWINSKGIYDI